jgi:hypothetical protein
MKLFRTPLAAILFGLSSFSAHALPPVCERVFAVASAAVSERDKGTTEEAMRSALPPASAASKDPTSPQSQLLEVMHKIVTEVYGGDPLPRLLYASYRAERCLHELQGNESLSSFDAIRLELLECGALSEELQVECAMKLAAP